MNRETPETRTGVEAIMLLAMSEHHSGDFEEAKRIIKAQLAAIEAAGVRLVPVEASYDLEFARMADGTIKVGYNPRTEEGGWALVGDVTKSVTAIEAQRDQALRDLDAANQRLSNVFAALSASPYATGDAP